MDSAMQDQPLPPFFWPLGQGEPPSTAPADCRVIGHDEGSWLVSSVGAVESRSPIGLVRFVNSSLHAFERSLRFFEPIWRRRSSQDNAEASRDVETFRLGLQEIDPPALADPESWWSAIIEQMQNDLL